VCRIVLALRLIHKTARIGVSASARLLLGIVVGDGPIVIGNPDDVAARGPALNPDARRWQSAHSSTLAVTPPSFIGTFPHS